MCAKLQRLGLKRAHKPPTSKPVILSVRRRPADVAPRPHPVRKSLERVDYTKRELQEMLAKAVKNTG